MFFPSNAFSNSSINNFLLLIDIPKASLCPQIEFTDWKVEAFKSNKLKALLQEPLRLFFETS
jgi:hypothetical protein